MKKMNNPLLYLIALVFLLVSCSAFGNASLSKEEDERALAIQQHHLNKANNAQHKRSDTKLTAMPTTVGSPNYSGDFTYFSDTATLTFWREVVDGKLRLFVQVTPTTNSYFVCGSGHLVTQNGMEYESLKFVDINFNSICGDISTPQIVLIDQWTFKDNFDDSQAFNISHRGDNLNVPSYFANSADADRIFDYAEKTYPQYFSPANQTSYAINNYWLRYYPNTDSYVGYNQDDDSIYVYGAVFGGLLKIAPLSDMLVQIQPATSNMQYIKLDSQGNELPDNATTWDCVKDTNSNLVWEVKTTDGGLRDWNHTYSWYNSTGVDDGGDAGTANGGSCFDTINCDIEKFTQQVNEKRLCGASDWRMPSTTELETLSIEWSSTYTVNTEYFPYTRDGSFPASEKYWTTGINGADKATALLFDNSVWYARRGKDEANFARLVRTE